MVGSHVRAANIGHEVEVLDQMIEEGLLDELGRNGEPQPHPRHGPHGLSYRPPAIAGTMETESPGFSVVLAPSRKRMSSSLT